MRPEVVYCVVPRELAPDLHEHLREHWRDDPSVVVVVERRREERRRRDRRRRRIGEGPERRRIRGPAGRRVAERRTTAMVEDPPSLPAAVAAYAARLKFLAPLNGGRRDVEDVDTDRLVVRIQAGDGTAFDMLYLRYFDRVYAYARVALRDAHEAEDIAQQVFGKVIEALPRYEVRDDASFRSWLFRITRNTVLRTLSRSGRLRLEEPAELDRRLESPTPVAPLGLDWLSDTDLAMLVERLPLSQRQVILLRYVFSFTTDEIADTLERTPVAVRMLEHRAMRALEARLEALRGLSGRCVRASLVARTRVLPVLTSRRLALRSHAARVL